MTEESDAAALSLSDALRQKTVALANGLEATLLRHIANLPAPPTLSAATEAQIKKRVPPKALPRLLTPERAIALLALEIEDIGTRISHYQFIERYREHFNAPDQEWRAAFVTHTHILRGSEIYVIMERSCEWLDFFASFAGDIGIAATKQSKALQNKFKKHFERHLRERHRIVHVHERPSLVSRMLSVPPAEMGRPEVADVFATVLGALTTMMKESLGEAANGASPQQTFATINDLRLRAVDKECLDMWDLFQDAINSAIDLSSLLK